MAIMGLWFEMIFSTADTCQELRNRLAGPGISRPARPDKRIDKYILWLFPAGCILAIGQNCLFLYQMSRYGIFLYWLRSGLSEFSSLTRTPRREYHDFLMAGIIVVGSFHRERVLSGIG
jgi:hypothetical protein